MVITLRIYRSPFLHLPWESSWRSVTQVSVASLAWLVLLLLLACSVNWSRCCSGGWHGIWLNMGEYGRLGFHGIQWVIMGKLKLKSKQYRAWLDGKLKWPICRYEKSSSCYTAAIQLYMMDMFNSFLGVKSTCSVSFDTSWRNCFLFCMSLGCFGDFWTYVLRWLSTSTFLSLRERICMKHTLPISSPDQTTLIDLIELGA